MPPGPCRIAPASLCVALALGGCQTAAPDTAVPIPTAYKAAPRGAPREAPPKTWVATFGSAELNRLVAAALTDNLDIEAAIQRINQAQAQTVIASAPLFPTLGGSSDASRQQSSARARAADFTGRASAQNSFGIGLQASYELDVFGRNRYAARAAAESAVATRYERDTVALTTVATVANTYFAVLAAQDRLRIAEDNLRIAGRVLDAIRGRVNVGTGTALDLAQQETVVATQRASIPPLRQDVAQNRNALAVLVGRTPDAVRVAGGSLDRLRMPGTSARRA